MICEEEILALKLHTPYYQYWQILSMQAHFVTKLRAKRLTTSDISPVVTDKHFI